MQAVADMIAVNKGITDLNLTCNAISDQGLGFINKALSSNNTLQKLNLFGNWIGAKGSIDAVNELLDVISRKRNIVSINLGANRLSTEAATKVAKFAQGHPTLSTVEIAWNHMPDEEQLMNRLNREYMRALAKGIIACASVSHDVGIPTELVTIIASARLPQNEEYPKLGGLITYYEGVVHKIKRMQEQEIQMQQMAQQREQGQPPQPAPQ